MVISYPKKKAKRYCNLISIFYLPLKYVFPILKPLSPHWRVLITIKTIMTM